MYFQRLIDTVVGGTAANEVKTPASVSKFHGFAGFDTDTGRELFTDTFILYEPAVS
jgi:hypothetical protein